MRFGENGESTRSRNEELDENFEIRVKKMGTGKWIRRENNVPVNFDFSDQREMRNVGETQWGEENESNGPKNLTKLNGN